MLRRLPRDARPVAAFGFFLAQENWRGQWSGQAAQTRQPVISNHLEKDERVTRQAVVKAGFRQIACIPLPAHGEIVGVLTLPPAVRRRFQERPPTTCSIASGAGTAIENAVCIQTFAG